MSYIWGKKLANYSEKNKFLRNEQYGSRKRKRSQNAIFNKILSDDISRILRMESIFIKNDAVNCYDRIIQKMADIMTQRLGLTKKAATYQTKILKCFKHHIRTNKGRSEKYFKYETTYPIYGTGQGTGWSPTIWTSVKDIIIRTLHNNNAHILYTNPNRTIESKRNSDAFVDDTSIGSTKASIPTNASLLEEVNKMAQNY